MHDDPRIGQIVQEILTGSGLPTERRREVAEEWRCHLDQSVASRCAAGMGEDEAVESALAAFGPSACVRRQLRQRQRRLDAGQACREALRRTWQGVLYAGMFSLLPALVAAVAGWQSFQPATVTLVFFLQLLVIMVFLLGGVMCNLQFERGMPVEEHRFLSRLAHWMLVVMAGLVWLLALGMVTAAGCVAMMKRGMLAGISPWQFCRNFGIAWLHPPAFVLIVCTIGIIGLGITLTLYERRRCIVE